VYCVAVVLCSDHEPPFYAGPCPIYDYGHRLKVDSTSTFIASVHVVSTCLIENSLYQLATLCQNMVYLWGQCWSPVVFSTCNDIRNVSSTCIALSSL